MRPGLRDMGEWRKNGERGRIEGGEKWGEGREWRNWKEGMEEIERGKEAGREKACVCYIKLLQSHGVK